MYRLEAFLIAAALASASAWAQADDQSSARKSGADTPRGVVTGGTSEGGIALQKDAAKGHDAVPVTSGGVSLNARDNLRSETPDHNVKMVFALNTGNYVSDVQVKVTDKSGRTVVDEMSNGPWLFAKLPPGSYTATATYNGKAVTQRFSVGKSGVRTAQFRWPASVEQQAVGAAESGGYGQILGTGPEEPQR
jgi:hypothetical protein